MPRSAAPPLADAVRRALAGAADPERAPAMQAYMKSAMPFHGVGAAERRKLLHACLATQPLADARAWQRAILDLWERARHREERYAAVDLVLLPSHRRFLTLESLPLLEKLVTSGAWWDYVDSIAAHGLGKLLRDEPTKMKRTLRKWSRSSDLWKRRSAVLAQLRAGAKTDLPFLYACIEDNLEDDDFFMQKAIGWALRQYAWVDEKEVKRYVAVLGARLPPLSRREALKNVGRALQQARPRKVSRR